MFDKLKNVVSGKKFVNIIAILLFIAAAIIFAVPMFASGDYDTAYADNNAKIEELQAELDALQNKSTADEVTPESVQVNLNSASDIGVEVASLQNNYYEIQTDSSIPVDAEEQAAQITANADKLRKYFSDGLDAQAIWFNSAQKYTWVFTTTYSIMDAQIPCLFLCYADPEDSGSLLAYVKATYDSAQNKFVSFSESNTSLGDAYLSRQYTDEDGKTRIVDDEQFEMPTVPSNLKKIIDEQNGSGGDK